VLAEGAYGEQDLVLIVLYQHYGLLAHAASTLSRSPNWRRIGGALYADARKTSVEKSAPAGCRGASYGLRENL
jgi:hypothetical protein